MAEQTPNPIDPFPDDDAPIQGGTSLFGMIKILAFVVGVIAVELAVVFMVWPSAAETAEMARSSMGADAAEGGEEEPEDVPLADQTEVDLGEFVVTSYQPVSNTTLRIDFHLYGTVAKDDESEFLNLIGGNLQRFRAEIITLVRKAEVGDLMDPELGLLKRQALKTTNRLLGKPLLQEILFPDFSFVET